MAKKSWLAHWMHAKECFREKVRKAASDTQAAARRGVRSSKRSGNRSGQSIFTWMGRHDKMKGSVCAGIGAYGASEQVGPDCRHLGDHEKEYRNRHYEKEYRNRHKYIGKRMEERETSTITISVRNLVEFILQSGDIDNRVAHGDMTSMQEGSRLHRKIQKAQGEDYRAEVGLKHEAPVEYDGESFLLCVEGRADGIFTLEEEPENAENESLAMAGMTAALEGIQLYPITCIDEIKTTLANVEAMETAVPVHRSQAMCYAYIYARQNACAHIAIRMTYCNQDSEEIKYFYELFEYVALEEWFDKLINEYAKWAAWQAKWIRKRNASILKAVFPFEYRPGQRELVGNVYATINHKKRLFIEAPTGVGKTMSTIFPAVWAMGEGKIKKIFYGTAKTIARTVAEEAFRTLTDRDVNIKSITLTSKEKICILEKTECNPVACARAKGHFDRVNDAVYDLLTHEERISRQLIEEYAAKHEVCPFEMSLDVSTWCDAVICDYNYIFDPNAHLRRFFENEADCGYCLLIDEAHNLVERAREMYSAELVKESFLEAKASLKAMKKHESWKAAAAADRLAQVLENCNRSMLNFKRGCDDFEVWEDCDALVANLMRFAGVYEDVSKDLRGVDTEKVLELYFDARHFMAMYDTIDGDYSIYSDYTPDRRFRLRLQCMDPRKNLEKYLIQARSAILFSATLLPIGYYMEQLGGRKDTDYAVYAPSPFDTSHRLLLVGRDVSTKYTRRSDSEYERIASYIETFVNAKTGNYMVFFPSYSMMESVAELLEDRIEGVCAQGRTMTEQEKEEFLDSFTENPQSSRVGLCVMGGIFAEGIDLKSDRLIGVVVVGTGLPMVCNERELFRGFFDEKNGHGFEYAYLYNGMNKVMQAAGRVIRTESDRGAILLLDERFLNRQYLDLFPREWTDYKCVTVGSIEQELEQFWR